MCPKRVCISSVGVRDDLYHRDPNSVLVTEFFGSVRKVLLTEHLIDIPEVQLYDCHNNGRWATCVFFFFFWGTLFSRFFFFFFFFEGLHFQENFIWKTSILILKTRTIKSLKEEEIAFIVAIIIIDAALLYLIHWRSCGRLLIRYFV